MLNKVKDLNSNLELKIAVATKELAQKNKENEALSARNMNWFVSVLKLLSLTIEVRDPLIRGHAERVTKYSQAIWDELSSEFTGSQETRQTLFTACMMLDIGRQAMPEELLKKKTQLTPEEWAVMKKQPVVGAQIIKQVDELKHVSEIILAHRERFDGTGYPKGLKAESIPIESRILAVADVYDAMTTDRPFRPRKEGFEALEEIKRGMGTQFDPIIAQAFINAYSKDKIANR